MKYFLLICFVTFMIPQFLEAQIIPQGLSEDSLYFNAPSWDQPPHEVSIYSFYYYKPSSYDPLTSPILFAIHGDGGNGAGVINLIDSIAERRRALIVAPNLQTSGSMIMQEAIYSYPDSTHICSILGPATAVFKDIYRHVLQRENRLSIPSYLMGFSAGGQFTTRYMLIRQAYPDSIPIQMAVSINPAFYTFPTDSFNGAGMPWACGLSFSSLNTIGICDGVNDFFDFNCIDNIRQYYNENYGILIGTADTLPYGGGCMNIQGANRYERAVNFHNYADSNAITLGTTLKWQYVEIPGIAHYEYGMYNTKANVTDTSSIAETLLFDTPHHTVPLTSPLANFYVDSTFVGAYSTIHFTNTSTGATNYLWDFGDSTTSTLTNPTHSYVTAGIYTVQLRAMNTNGCNNLSIKRFYITVTGSHNGTLAEFQKVFWNLYSPIGFKAHQTNDGGYAFFGTGLPLLSSGTTSMFIAKLKSNGDSLWIKHIGNGFDAACNDGQQTVDGGFILAGTTKISGSSAEDFCLIKLDSTGTILWSKSYGIGGSDVANSVRQTSDGGYIAFGTSGQALLIKTDMNGDTLWTKRYGGTNFGSCVALTNDGGFVLTGYSILSTGNHDAFLIRTNANGDTLWSRSYGGPAIDEGQTVEQTRDHGYIISGTTTSFNATQTTCSYIIKTDSIGNVLWAKSNDSLNRQLAIMQSFDGGYIIAGSLFIANGLKGELIKADATCNFIWAKTYGTTSQLTSVDTTNDGGYLATGYDLVNSVGSAYLVKTDSMGHSGCLESDTNYIFINAPTTTTSFYPVISSGCIVSNAPMIAINGSKENTLCSAYVGINEIVKNENSILVYPNPTNGEFTVVTNKIISNGFIEVYSALGKAVLKRKISNQSKIEVNPNALSSGIYFIRVYDGMNSYSSKIIIK